MKYLMQQPTSCTLKCFPDILAFDKFRRNSEKFLPVIINDGEKKSPNVTDWKTHFFLLNHIYGISTDWPVMR